VDDRFLELAEKAKGAAERFAERFLDWLNLFDALRLAEDRVGLLLERIADGASPHQPEPSAKVWREGGRVKVWLSPQLKEELERRLAKTRSGQVSREAGLRRYLRKVSKGLGREVELVGEEPPFRFSPEVDRAAEELKQALRELVGSA
jgi:hypothetical protein